MRGRYLKLYLAILVMAVAPLVAGAWQVKVGGDESLAWAVRFDSTGNIAAAGTIDGSMAAVKLTPQGATQWTAKPFGAADGRAAALDIGSNGSIAIAGMFKITSPSTSNEHLAAALLNPGNGQAIWTDVNPGTRNQSASSIVIDAADNVFVGGRASGPGNASRAFAVHQVPGNGWATALAPDPVNGDYPGGVAADLAIGVGQEIIAAGRTHTLEVGGTNTGIASTNILVAKLDNSTGAVIWQTKIPEPSDAYGIAVDGSGDVYLSGSISEDLSSFGGVDFAVIKLDGTDGSEIWRYVVEDPGDNSAAIDIVVGDGGNVYAAGSVDLGGAAEMTVVKLDGTTGGEIWRSQIANDVASIPGALIPGVEGDAYALTVDAAGNIVAAGMINATWIPIGPGATRDFAVAKFDADDGAVHWINNFGFGQALDVDVHPSGQIAASGHTEYSPQRFTIVGFSDLIAAKSLKMRDHFNPARRSLKLVARDYFIHAPSPGTAGDPTIHGATLVVQDAASGARRVLDFPAEHWKLKGKGRYSYRNKTGSTTCTKATVRAGTLAIVCKGSDLDLPSTEGPLSAVAAEFALGSRGGRLCTLFGGDVRSNDDRRFAARNAGRPDTCSAY